MKTYKFYYVNQKIDMSNYGRYFKQDSLFKRRYISKTPLKRMTRPDDIANAMIFLASNASSYITGNDIRVDGGISIV